MRMTTDRNPDFWLKTRAVGPKGQFGKCLWDFTAGERLREKAATAEWQAAIQALMLVAELDGPTMFERIGLMRALNRHVERVFDPSRKDRHWGRRKLGQDQ